MKLSDKKRLEEQLDQWTAAQSEKRKIDKMSLRFILPMVLFYLIVGVLLIWLENLVTTVASIVVAVALIVVGAGFTVRYLRSDIARRLAGIDLAFGLILLLSGILLIISPRTLESILPAIWGQSLIFGGFLKIQYAFDEKSVNIRRWWIMLIFAGVSIVIGILALLNSSIFGESQHLVIGIFMLAEAVLDLVIFFLLTRGMKKQEEAKNASPVPVESVPDEPVPDVPVPVTPPQEIPVPQVQENLDL